MIENRLRSMVALLIKWIMLFFASIPVNAQVSEVFILSDDLKEISGLELLNDSTLVAFNDGGNKSEIYLLNLQGEIKKVVDVLDTKNRDWEDITRDDEYIYIGDIGNNLNKRNNLSIVKIKIADLLQKDEVKAEKIEFSYAEQNSFPPEEDSLFYDAEGMALYNDSIWVFTKDRSVPFQGLTHIYKIPTKPGTYKVSASHKIDIGDDGWWKDGITGVDYFENQFYILTYNRYIVMNIENGELNKTSEHIFDAITQRESIVVLNNEAIFVADEHNPIVGDVKMYKIQP